MCLGIDDSVGAGVATVALMLDVNALGMVLSIRRIARVDCAMRVGQYQFSVARLHNLMHLASSSPSPVMTLVEPAKSRIFRYAVPYE